MFETIFLIFIGLFAITIIPFVFLFLIASIQQLKNQSKLPTKEEWKSGL